MNLRLRPVAGLVLAGLILSACSGSAAAPTAAGPGQSSAAGAPTSAPASAPAMSDAPAASVPAAASTVDACTLVTEPEATTFLGSDPGPGVSTGTADQPACAHGASLTLSIQPGAGKTQYDADRGAASGSGNPRT